MPEPIAHARRAAAAAVLLALTVASGCDVLRKPPPCSFPVEAKRVVDTTLAVGEVARFYALKGETPLFGPLDEEQTLADFPEDPDEAPYNLTVTGPVGVVDVTPLSQDLQPDSEMRVEAERPGSRSLDVLAFGRTDGCDGASTGTGITVEVVEARETP
jgi:hypothetical protein